MLRFPRLYAAASLKQPGVESLVCEYSRFPRLYAAASLKPVLRNIFGDRAQRFSAALCRGLIEAKEMDLQKLVPIQGFSAALCRGLIEAGPRDWHRQQGDQFSAALCRGLIEALTPRILMVTGGGVFRGFMPRPH